MFECALSGTSVFTVGENVDKQFARENVRRIAKLNQELVAAVHEIADELVNYRNGHQLIVTQFARFPRTRKIVDERLWLGSK